MSSFYTCNPFSLPSTVRHPSNLMLDRLSGRILHIDFGDCFEVAMTREKFPEKIPFRLTRMLTNAMEVGERERERRQEENVVFITGYR